MIRNFLFHRVNPQRDPLWDPMDPTLFDKVIAYISKKYEIVLFEDLAFDKQALNTKNKYATIMFDDGYKDNYEFAFPILEKYNAKASFYVVTDCIDNDVPTWTHILEHSFQFTNATELALPFDFLPEKFQKATFVDQADRLQFVSGLKPFLKTIAHSKRNQVLDVVASTFTDVQIPSLMMSWDEVRALREAGHYVGSHTVTHCMLGTMENEEDIKHELVQSGKRIEQELGYFPLTISYPVGSYDNRTKKISEEVGYKIGLAVHQDTYKPNNNLFEVSRIELYNESWFKTKLRISNVLENFKKIIKYR